MSFNYNKYLVWLRNDSFAIILYWNSETGFYHFVICWSEYIISKTEKSVLPDIYKMTKQTKFSLEFYKYSGKTIEDFNIFKDDAHSWRLNGSPYNWRPHGLKRRPIIYHHQKHHHQHRQSPRQVPTPIIRRAILCFCVGKHEGLDLRRKHSQKYQEHRQEQE